MDPASILLGVAAVIGAIAGLATALAPFFPKRPEPPALDDRSKAAKIIDRLSVVPTGILARGPNGNAPDKKGG